MKTADYCRAAKLKLGLDSDYALAKHLGVAKQTVSNYVNGHRVLDNTAAAQISLILGIDFLKVVADCELERGSRPEIWKKLRDAAVVATMAIGAASFGALPEQAHASGFNINVPANTHCAARRRSIGAALAALVAWLAGMMATAL